jgi:hypothetical protein
MKTPHIHAELIKAWADGAEIQMDVSRAEEAAPRWADTSLPTWASYVTYRIKPKPTPDVVYKKYVYENDIKQLYMCDGAGANVKYTFDGETGKLKAVEILSN